MITHKATLPIYVTKDQSLIRELMHPLIHGNCKHSLAEARVAAGQVTALHRHICTEESYHIILGQGRMILGSEFFNVIEGDTILISPGIAHQIENIGHIELVFLCCCVPAYSHEDTELL